MKRISIAASLALLGACATSMSEEDCAGADWYALGYQGGLQGQSEIDNREDFARRAEQCREYGAPAEGGLFAEGYQDGLVIYCTPRGVLSMALDGKGDVYACRAPSALMVDAAEVGQALRRARSRHDSADSAYRNRVSEIDRLRSSLSTLRRRLRKHTDEDTIREIRAEIDETIERLEDIRYDLYRYEDDGRRAAFDLQRAQRDYDQVAAYVDEAEERRLYDERYEEELGRTGPPEAVKEDVFPNLID